MEEATDDDVRSIYDVNVFGLLATTRAVAPVMRAARSGTIVNISSVGGFRSSAGFGIYCSTKFAVEAVTEALREELAPLGITVGLVEPGYFRTDFLDGSSLHVSAEIADYADGPSGQTRASAADVNHAQPGDPVRAAGAIVAAVDGGDFPVRLFLGRDTIAVVEGKLASVGEEVERQRANASSTDHEDAAAV